MSDEINPRFDPGNNSENPKIIGERFLRTILGVFQKNIDADDMNNVVRRLGDIGWLEGISLVKSDEAAVHLSPKGKEKMLEFANLCMAKTPGQSGNLSNFSLVAFYKNEFNPPLTFRESSALGALLLEYFIKNIWRNLPPPGGAPPAA